MKAILTAEPKKRKTFNEWSKYVLNEVLKYKGLNKKK